MQDIDVCFCSHGFTGNNISKISYIVMVHKGSKCQKRIRKALLIGGLDEFETRNDTELVAGLEVRKVLILMLIGWLLGS